MSAVAANSGRVDPTVNAYGWNPLFRYWTRPATWPRRPNNFGDLIGPLLVKQLAFPGHVREIHRSRPRKLLSVGSVLHFARTGDCVWGSGINGKVTPVLRPGVTLDVRAVRGPLTARKLTEHGQQVPEVYGDPALLLPVVFPGLTAMAAAEKWHRVTVIPNLNDKEPLHTAHHVLDPTSDLDLVLRTIARSELVVGSSLHAVIVAEALGIPARLITTAEESRFKYDDYYEGTGRANVSTAASVEAAVDLGGVTPMDYDTRPLLDAFPIDLWR